MKAQFHKYPARLEFNCFREGLLISEPFQEDKLEEAKQWATDTIEQITENENWSPKLDYFKCKNICDIHDECEYYNMIDK